MSVIGFCFNVDCPCPREEIECPADSVYFQRRTSDCCVEWECKCPSFSCPYSMSCGDGIQPNAVVRGHGSPGWCCPNFEYEGEIPREVNDKMLYSSHLLIFACV